VLQRIAVAEDQVDLLQTVDAIRVVRADDRVGVCSYRKPRKARTANTTTTTPMI
jgi:hypothetical protein